MEKSQKGRSSKYSSDSAEPHKAEEPVAAYQPHKAAVQVKDFTYKDYKKVADKVALSQQEWADILHISERTLQRYAKSNGIFSFPVTDRILQIEKVIKKGTAVFGSPASFMEWLKARPQSLEGQLSLHSLSTIDGIQHVLRALGRIEQGLFS